jgi:serine/threonine protein kinase
VSDEVPEDAGGFLAEVVAGFGTGSRIAGYRLEEQVGAGGMAVVFRARDERLGRLVALKILSPALAADEAFQQRFIRESRAAATVDHPHIVPVFDAGEASGVLFIAMRYVPDGDVRTMMHREGPLPAARAVAVISQVASALDAAHRAGLVHRDVKPGNMLVDAQAGRPDHVYLSDFGLSKGALSTSVALTGAGQFLGTVDYISPEQIEGRPVDGRADEYALACAAFEMLTGAPPFRRDEVMAVMYAQLSEPPPPLTSRRPDLSPAADQVFARALAKAPGDRYATCREFADALRGAFGLAAYDSGPGVIPGAGYPPTQTGWPAAGVTAPDLISPAPGEGPPTWEADIPARRDGRRRFSPVTLAGISALAVAAIAALVIVFTLPSQGPTSFSKRTAVPTPVAVQSTKAGPARTPTVTATTAPAITPPTAPTVAATPTATPTATATPTTTHPTPPPTAPPTTTTPPPTPTATSGTLPASST